MATVGVQLHGVAQVLNGPQQPGKIRPQQRLAAGDGHTVQQALPLFQKGQQSGVVHDRLHAAQHQAAVVAERAPKIAPRQKHRAGHMAGKIQQRQLLYSMNVHVVPSPFQIPHIVALRHSNVKMSTPQTGTGAPQQSAG